MQRATVLIGFVTVTACSLDHVVVAALDDASAAGSPTTDPGSSAPGEGADTATGGSMSAGSGGLMASARSPSTGEGGTVSFAPTLGGGSTIMGASVEGGGTSETRCSCLGRESEVCGSDGLSYPTACGDVEPCTPPGIACLQACPCPEPGGGSAEMGALTWFPVDCVPTARCRDGVICMTFADGTFDDTQTACDATH